MEEAGPRQWKFERWIQLGKMEEKEKLTCSDNAVNTGL